MILTKPNWTDDEQKSLADAQVYDGFFLAAMVPCVFVEVGVWRSKVAIGSE